MEKLTAEQIATIVESQGRWLRYEPGGERADFRGKDLSFARLDGARLDGARLDGARLDGASLDGVSLDGVTGIDRYIQAGPLGSRNGWTVYNLTKDNVRCGCLNDHQGGTLDEFEARVKENYSIDTNYGKEYAAAIAFFRAMKAMEVNS